MTETNEDAINEKPRWRSLPLIVAVGAVLIAGALLVTSGVFPYGGRIVHCESNDGNQNYFGLQDVPLGESVWFTLGSTSYSSSLIRSGAVPLTPIDIELLDQVPNLQIAEKLAWRIEGSLFNSTYGQGGPLTAIQQERIKPLSEATSEGWWPIARLQVDAPGDYEFRGVRVSYKAGIRTVTCDHTTGLRFTIKESADADA